MLVSLHARPEASQIAGFFLYVRKDPELLRLYYKFHCLPLLPAAEIVSAFHALKAQLLSCKTDGVELDEDDKREQKKNLGCAQEICKLL